MPVDTQHAQYMDSLEKWQLVRTCVAGAKAVRLAGEGYLPHPNKGGDDAVARYEDYVERAQFVNVTGRTRNAMVGMAFRKPSETDLPTQIEYLIENSTGDGVTLEQLGKNVVGGLLEVGRFGLLSDYPVTEPGLSQEQVNALGLQASIKCYPAESIINWSSDNGLTLVVLKESYVDSQTDEFKSEIKDQYRVLRLIDGIYNVEIWRDKTLFSGPVQPRDSIGQNLSVIPFVIAGAYANDPAVDDAALYDLAEVNIGHYRNSADYEEGVFLHGQPMLHIDTGTMTASNWTEANPNGIKVGARRGIITNGGGSASLLQTQANSAAFEAMAHKEKQMVALGARIIEQGGQAETAEAAKLKHAGDNSVLTNVVQNTSSAINQALQWCGLFMGANADASYKINEVFYDKTQTAQEVMADIQLYDRGIIAKKDIRDKQRALGNIAEGRTNEDIDTEAEGGDPTE